MGVGLGADGVFGHLVGVHARGRVAAVEDVLVADGVGVAVVVALADAEEVVGLGSATSVTAGTPGPAGVLPPVAEPFVGA